MRLVALAAMALLTGCIESESQSYDDTPGHDDATRECTLYSVDIIDDTSEVVGGFASAPDLWIAEMTGIFAGTVETPFGRLEGALRVEDNIGQVRVVSYTWDDTERLCAAWYEIGFGAGLNVGNGQLDEMFAATLLVDAGNVATFVLDIPLEELNGTLRPTDFADHGTSLRIEGDFRQLSWYGDLGWLGEIDDYEATIRMTPATNSFSRQPSQPEPFFSSSSPMPPLSA